MNRTTIVTQLVVQIDNEVQPPQYGAPVLMGTVTLVTTPGGQQAYQPAYRVEPAVPEDVSDDLLAVLNVKLGALGLEVTRKQ